MLKPLEQMVALLWIAMNCYKESGPGEARQVLLFLEGVALAQVPLILGLLSAIGVPWWVSVLPTGAIALGSQEGLLEGWCKNFPHEARRVGERLG